jgi:methionyl-tRNA formyltransferase
MLLAKSIDIENTDTTVSLTERLSDLGAGLLVQALRSVDTLTAEPQPNDGVTYAAKIEKAEAWLDWCMPADVLARRVRAFNPFPVAQMRRGETVIKVWRAEPVAASARTAPGTIVAVTSQGIDVACGEGVLRLVELQRPGGRRLPVREFLAGFPLTPSDQFDAGGV